MEWLESPRDIRARAIIRTRLDRVQLGNLGDCRRLSGVLHELRIDFGPGYRVYFAHETAETIVVLCGGRKRTQRSDIGRARQYWRDYGSREGA